MKYKELFKRIDLKLTGIIFLATFLRFYNYQDRWALAYDQAWFAVIGRHALNTFQLPFLGPFASGGPFQTGGEWFWIVMLGTALNPFSVMSPWIFITILSILQVFLFYILGREFKNVNFGYLLAVLGAVSTSQTLQATNLTSQMTASICATLFLLSVIKYIKTKNEKYLFFQAFFVGLSSAIHLQGILLLPALFIAVIFTKSISLRKLGLLSIGLITPWLPVLIVDVQNGFFNTKNMLMYFVQPQSQVPYEALGRRWLTFITEYLPASWGRIVGGFIFLGYLEIAGVSFFVVSGIIRRSIKKEMWIVILSTVSMTVILRYIRTPLYENYISFIHPFVFLLIGWVLYQIFNKSKTIGITILSIVILASITATVLEVSHSTNETAKTTSVYVKILKSKFPGKKFAIYDYKYTSTHKTLPLTLYLQTEGLIDDSGIKIGMAVASLGAQPLFSVHKAIYGEIGAYQLFDLSASTSADLVKSLWVFVNPSARYNSVQSWWKK